MLEEIKNFDKFIKDHLNTTIGFPTFTQLNINGLMYNFNFNNYLNNVGDPLVEGEFILNSKKFELKVLKYFSKLYELEEKDFFGYIGMGASEGNLFGFWLGREYLKKYGRPVFYFSEDSHYSVLKSVKIIDGDYIIVKSNMNGTININNLKEVIIPNRPIFICVNLGTTFKGAIDDIISIKKYLLDNNYNHYIHCDAAFFGAFYPFLQKVEKINFNIIDSLVISGHKFIGTKQPSSIILTKKMYVENITTFIEYVNVLDRTVSSSRNGYTALMLYFYIFQLGEKYIKKFIKYSFDIKNYLIKKLKSLNLFVFSNDNSPIVIFNKPNNIIIQKYALSTFGDFAHIVCLPHVTKEIIDEFIDDIKKTPIIFVMDNKINEEKFNKCKELYDIKNKI